MAGDAPGQLRLTLNEVLRLVESGSFGLPDFQRRFEWQAEQVQSLLASVFQGWPAGAILLMEAPPSEFFALRPLEGMSSSSEPYRHLVLDGQQRVTALAQAFGVTYRPGDPIWFVDMFKFQDSLASGEVEESFVRAQKAPALHDGRVLIPVAALRNPTEYQRWRDQASSETVWGYLEDVDSSMLDRFWLKALSGLRTFEFPCSVLPAQMPLSAVATIFEKLNTSGLPLDTFDLVVAHVYKDGHNLRAVWDSEVAKRPILSQFATSGALLAAELVAMVELGDTRRSGLLSLDPDVLWKVWPRAVQALENACRFLADQAGIYGADQLPHRGILLALAGAAFKMGGLKAQSHSLLLYWVYSRGLTERFNAAVNTRTVSEYRALVGALRGKESLWISLERSPLVSATRRANSSIWLTLQAMIRRRSPSDFPDGLIAAPPLAAEGTTAVSVVRGNDGASDRALGVVLGSPNSEKLLRSLNQYTMRDFLVRLDDRRVAEYLQAQLLPEIGSPHWQHSEEFLYARADLVAAELDLLNPAPNGDDPDPLPAQLERGGSESNISLVRDWISGPSLFASEVGRLEIGKRLAEDLLSQGKPVDAVAALQFLLESEGPLTFSERIEVSLLQAKALSASGLIDEAIELIVRTGRLASSVLEDPEVVELQPFVLSSLGSLLLDAGRVGEAAQVLEDALQSRAMSNRLRFSTNLELGRALLAIDRQRGIQLLRGILSEEAGLVDYADLVVRARELLDEAQSGDW